MNPSFNLTVSPNEVGELVEFYKLKRVELVDANRPVFNKLKEIDNMIAKLSQLSKNSEEDTKYPANGSWNQRIRFVLSNDLVGFGMTSREIVDAIAEAEGVEKGSDKWKDIYKGVAPSLSAGGKIYSKKPNKDGNTIYNLIQ